MNRLAGAWIAAVILSTSAPTYVAAEDPPPPLSSDRPGESTSPVVVPGGYVQLETGWQLTRDEKDDVVATALEIFGATIRIGLTRRAELDLSGLPYNEVEVDSGGDTVKERGPGDAEISAKINLAHQKGAWPEFGLLAGVTVPVGVDAFTADAFEPTLVFLFNNDLTKKLSFNYNLGVERLTVASELGLRETNNQLIYTGSLGIAVAPKFGVFAEVYGTRELHGEADGSTSFDTGATWLVLPRLQLDLSFGTGVTDPTTGRFVAAGLTVRFPH
jgi:hypothetical protein